MMAEMTYVRDERIERWPLPLYDVSDDGCLIVRIMCQVDDTAPSAPPDDRPKNVLLSSDKSRLIYNSVSRGESARLGGKRLIIDPDASAEHVASILSVLITEESVLLKDPCGVIHISRSLDNYRLHADVESEGHRYRTYALYGFWQDKLRMEILLDPVGRLKLDNSGTADDYAGAVAYSLACGSTMFAWHWRRSALRQARYKMMFDQTPSPATEVVRKLRDREDMSLKMSAAAARMDRRMPWLDPENIMTRARDADFAFAKIHNPSAWSAIESGWCRKFSLLNTANEALRRILSSSAGQALSKKHTAAGVMLKEPLVFVADRPRRTDPAAKDSNGDASQGHSVLSCDAGGGAPLAPRIDRWPVARFTLSQEGGQVVRIFSPSEPRDPPDVSKWTVEAAKVYTDAVIGESDYHKPGVYRPWMYNHYGIDIDSQARREDATSVVAAWLSYEEFDSASTFLWNLRPSFFLCRRHPDFALHQDGVNETQGHVLTALFGFVDDLCSFRFLFDENGRLAKTASGKPADYAGSFAYGMCFGAVMFSENADFSWMSHAIHALSRDCKDTEVKDAASRIIARSRSSDVCDPVVVRFRNRGATLNPGAYGGALILADSLYAKMFEPEIWDAFKRELSVLQFADPDAAMDEIVRTNAKDMRDKRWSLLRRITDQPLVCGAPLDVYDAQIGGRSLISEEEERPSE